MTDAAEIKTLRKASNSAIQAHDLPGTLAVMADDIVVTVGSGETLNGRTTVGDVLAAQYKDPDLLFVRSPKTIKVSRSGTDTPLAFEEGQWTGRWTGPNGQRSEAGGSYAASWRKEPGGWLITAEIFVTLRGSA